MFWGLIIEPHKRYTQVVEKSFHVSMASLDVSTAGAYTGVVQVMMNYENRNYLLCTLQKGTTLQVPLDLNFQEGTKIAFTSNGTGHVHLTGYLVPEEDDFDDVLEEEEEEDEDEAVPELVGKQAKRRASESLNQSENSVKRSKQNSEEESSEDEDDEDESDSEDPLGLEDLEDEEEDEEDEEEEEEEEVEVKPVVKKNKQDKKQPQQQQQQQQQTKKQEKQKLVNGKEAKQEQKQEKKVKGEQQQNNKQEPKKRVIEGGVQIEDLKVGTGKPAKSGKFISVYYDGRLKNGKKFDSCTQGDGFKFRLGKKEVIQGWDVGIAGMKIGGKRRITIPPAFAYGVKGSPPVIPPNSPLVFEVELKNVH